MCFKMKFIKDRKIESKKDVMEVVIKVMHGDRDLFQDVIIGDFNMKTPTEVELLKDLVNTLDRISNMSSTYGYLQVVGFDKWLDRENMMFNFGVDSYNSLDPKLKDLAISWPIDVTSPNTDCPVKLSAYNLFYYDENSMKYTIKVEKDVN